MKILDLNSTQKKKEKIEVKDSFDLFLIGNHSFDYELELALINKNARANVYGLLLGNQSQDFNLKITARHKAENTVSMVHIKTVLSNESVLNFEGLIRIENRALYSDAFLQNDNLLVTGDSIANSSPQLEILADDVKASHGVTIKDIDDNYKFYLMSRGLSEEESRGLVIKGFINDIVSKLNASQLSALSEKGYSVSDFM